MLTNLFQVAVLALAPFAAPAPGSVLGAHSIELSSVARLPQEGTAGEAAASGAEGATAPGAATTQAAPADGLAPDRVGPHVPEHADEIRDGTFWMPVAASDVARDVDATFNFIMWINYVFTALILVLLVVFVVKYRRRPGVVADQSITHNTPIEIIWSVLPTILVAVIFWQGYVTFLDLKTAPKETLKIRVSAYTWGWNFTYPDGTMVPQKLAVPQGQPVEFIMNSKDTLHSMHLPAFRQKQDVLPDRYTKIWFPTDRIGNYRIYCTEYCGKDHSNMYASLQILPQAEFDKWWEVNSNPRNDADGNALPDLAYGEKLYSYFACNSCHTVDGGKNTGPSFLVTSGNWGKMRPINGGEAMVDEDYVRRSILNPQSQIAEGFGPQMPVFNYLDDEQIYCLTLFIKSLAKN
ncbi:MAG: cytochrome c oxidase subunit II [Planctomycetota bacterium]